MTSQREGWESPPLEAYSRVTNAQRFEPLLDFVADYFDKLGVEFDVTRTSQFPNAPEDGLPPFDYSRSPIHLAPSTANAASLAVGYTSFPGVIVRCGFWRIEPFPSCGCDACGETSASEIKRFSQIVDAVVAGRFAETAKVPLFGRAFLSHRYVYDDGGGSGGGRYLPRAHARALTRDKPRSIVWAAWGKRRNE